MRTAKRTSLLVAALWFLGGCAAAHTSKQVTSPPPPETPAEEYGIGPDDVLQVDIWKRPELSREVTVRPDGFISLPLVKDVRAIGLSASSLSQVLREKFKEFVEDPEVTVIVRTANSYKIYVLGQVATSGMFTLKSPVSVVQAVAMAGGFTPFAKTSRVVVIRREQGRDVRIEVDYDDVVDGKHPEKNILLRPGDTVVVP